MYYLKSQHSKVTDLNTSDDEGWSVGNEDIDENLDPFSSFVVEESSKYLTIPFESLRDDGFLDDLRIVDFQNPGKGYFWFEFGEPCYDISSIESEGILDDAQSVFCFVSTLSMLSLHPSKDIINEPYYFL